MTNPSKTWYYNAPFVEGEPGEVLIKKTGKMVISKFFDILKNGLKSNDLYKVESKKEHYEVSFSKEIIPEIGIRKSILSFKSQNANPQFVDINYIDLHYTDKRVVKMTFSKIEESIIFSKKRFTFQVPENTQVSKQ